MGGPLVLWRNVRFWKAERTSRNPLPACASGASTVNAQAISKYSTRTLASGILKRIRGCFDASLKFGLKNNTNLLRIFLRSLQCICYRGQSFPIAIPQIRPDDFSHLSGCYDGLLSFLSERY